MTREEFERLEDKLIDEIAKRRQLGGYNTDAPTLEFLCRAVFELSRHLSSQLPIEKKKS